MYTGRRVRPARDRAGKGLVIFLLVIGLLGAGAAGLYVWATGASGPSRPVEVEIPSGATAADVGALLEERDVIRSALAFRVAARMGGLGEEIAAGTYELSTNMSLFDVLDVLRAGPLGPREITLSIPEGWEVGQIAAAAADSLGFGAERFLEAATGGDHALPPYLPDGSETVEGFLFPKTYGFAEDAGPDDVIRRLLSQFEAEVERLPWSRADRLGLTPYEVVVVASMIEREARVARDRPLVSSVIYNRLQVGMRLQIDATVQYALPEENRPLTNQDYEYESPYNTYLIDGLPPTPIGSPGLDSLRAALRPADTDYLFFVVVDEESGRHEFAETYEEFLRLKAEAGL